MAQGAPTMPPLRPAVGFCLQAKSTGSPPGRWFINVVKHKLVEMPVAHSGQTVSKEWILTHGIASLQVPFDLGSWRKVKGERGEGAKQTTWAIDAVLNPLMVQLFMDDDFCGKMDQYRGFVISLILKRIEESVNVNLPSSSIKLMKNFRYKDGEDGDSAVAREFTELPADCEGFDAEMERPAPRQEEPEEPLIEDVTPGVIKKPVLKKGFFNSGKSDLYGPEGSKEGVLPENAGDPLGYLPKKLRNSCKIVDTASPEYQASQANQNAQKNQNDEFKDTILKDMEKWAKKTTPDKWESDLPDGTEPEPRVNKKYDNDYSRFDEIEIEEETTTLESRDYYFDEKGNPKKFEQAPQVKAASSTAGTGPTSESAVKKGFLTGAKTALYPEGSREGKTGTGMDSFKDKLNDPALLKEFENMAPEELAMMGDLKSMLENSAKMSPPGSVAEPKQPVAPKLPDRRVPQFVLNDVEDGLQLIIQVPELESMRGVDLDVTERRASLVFPASVSLKPLQVELPTAVVPTNVKAKFSKKTRQITVTLPAASAAKGGA